MRRKGEGRGREEKEEEREDGGEREKWYPPHFSAKSDAYAVIRSPDYTM